MTDGYISGKHRTSYLIIVRNHVSGLDAASLGFGVASTQRFKGLGWPRRQRSFNLINLGGLERVNFSGRGAAGGGT